MSVDHVATAPNQLTTGDLWNDETGQPIVGAYQLQAEVPEPVRRSAAYLSRFRKRETPLRLIRMKCGACMGGELMTLPRGEVA